MKHFYSHSAELTWVAEDIATRLSNGDDAGRIAVLARGNATVQEMHEVLDIHNVEHTVVGVQNDLYAQTVIRNVIEALKAIADPLDSTALFHTLAGPAFELPQNELTELASNARLDRQTLAQAIAGSNQSEFKSALEQIETWRMSSAETTVRRLVYDIITDSGWKNRLFNQARENPELVIQTQALSEFFMTLKEFERIANIPSVQSYMDNFETLRSGGDTFDGTDSVSTESVNVMTVHKSKGLEWKTVYVINCVQGSFPSTSGSRGIELPPELLHHTSHADDRLSEERRAMYVAATRARRELILTYSDRVREDGARRKPSIFLTEMFGDSVNQAETYSNHTDIDIFGDEGRCIAGYYSVQDMRNDIYTLTASQIACYLKCPLDFYYKHILGIPQAEGASASYGTAIHAGIQYIGEQRLLGRTPTYEEVLEIVEGKLPTRGFASDGIKRKNYETYAESTRRMYDRFTSEALPLYVEKPFNVAVPDLPVHISGRLDAVYQVEKGIEIRDYKTNRAVRTAEDAKKRAGDSKQLTVYALAWLLEHGELPEAEVLDFVETGQRGQIKRTARAVATLRDNLAKMVKSMETNNYPLGHSHDYCSHPPVIN